MQCPQCKSKAIAGAKFCHQCGQNLEPPTSAGGNPQPVVSNTGAQRRPTWASDPNLISSIRRKNEVAQENLSGTRRHVTILFADIQGFTTLCESLDPEMVTELMNQYLGRLGEIVYEFEGYIDKFMGDSVLALFGAPIAHENDPELAVRTAIRMMEEVQKTNADTHRNLALRIGINSGLVLAGGIGVQKKFEFTAMGDAVNTAQRLQSSAKPNEILIGKTVAKAVDASFNLEQLAPLKLKGKTETVEAFRVCGVRNTKNTKQSSTQFTSKLVERDKEVEALKSSVQKFKRQKSAVKPLALVGPAGIGKTRLKFELKNLCLQNGIAWYEVQGSPLKSGSPLFVFKSLLLELLKKELLLDPKTREFSLRTGSSLPIRQTEKAAIEDLLDLHFEKLLQLDSAEKRRLIFSAVRSVLRTLSANRSFAIFFEDFQNIDIASRELISFLTDEPMNFLLALSLRDEFRHLLPKGFWELNLRPLSHSATAELVHSFLKGAEAPQKLLDVLNSRCHGNPLFIEETLKAHLDSGKLKKKSEDSYLLTETVQQNIPESIQALIVSRIDTLYQGDREVLEYAAVIGRSFSDQILRRVLKNPSHLNDSIQFLLKKEFIQHIEAQSNRIEYAFPQILVQEVIYDSILKKRRAQMHKEIGETIEAMVKEGGIINFRSAFEDLAFHFLNAESEREKAVFYLIETARNKMRASEASLASADYEKAYAIANELPEKERIKWLPRIGVEWTDVLIFLADYQRADNYLGTLEALAEKAMNKTAYIQILRRKADSARRRRDFVSASQLLGRCLTEVEPLNMSQLKVEILKSLGNLEREKGDFQSSLAQFQNAIQESRKLTPGKLIGELLNDLGVTFLLLNDLTAAQTSFEKVQALNDPTLSVRALNNLGTVGFRHGKVDEAYERFKEAADLAVKIGDSSHQMKSLHNQGLAALKLHRFEEALKLFRESSKIAEALQSSRDQTASDLFSAFIQMKYHDFEKGQASLRGLLAKSQKNDSWDLYIEGKQLLISYWRSVEKPQMLKREIEDAEATLQTCQDEVLKKKFLQEIAKANKAA